VAITVAVLHGLIALATLSHPIFFGTVGRGNIAADIRAYYEYASKAVEGSVPYRDYPVEYPIFAIPLFLLPRLFTSSFEHYQVVFGLEMLLANALTILLVAAQIERTEGARRVVPRLAWLTFCFASLCPMLMFRFDLAVAAVTFAAACTWCSGRSALGGTLAGIGTLVKIVPGVVAAPALVWEVEEWKTGRGRGLICFAISILAGAGIWVAIGGGRVRDSLDYHLGRGVEIGSLFSGLLMLVARASGSALAIEYHHSCVEVLTSWSPWAAALGFPLQALALAVVIGRTREANGDERLRYSAAAILSFVLFGKVLSPQYLVWLLPFLAVIRGRTGLWVRGLFLLACLVTSMLFPAAFHWLLLFRGWMIGLLNYRNALLLGLWFLLLFGPQVRSGERPFGAARPGARRTEAVLVA
jgi:hypothetical protein